MKRKILLYNAITLLLVFLTTSCQDFLDEKAYDQLAESSFPTSFDDLNLISNGIYARFSYYHLRYGAYEYMTFCNSVEGCFNKRGGGSERGGGDHYSWQLSPDFRDSFRRNFYWAWEVITQANDALNAMKSLEGSVDQDLLDRVEGEAKAFRAWVYFDLVRFYGAMPIITGKTHLVDEELFIERPEDVRVTYDFIIQDLTDAIELLPSKSDYAANPNLGEEGRMSKGAAEMLLAKVYLTMNGYPLNDSSKLADAKTLLEQIVSSDEYMLLNNYPDIFSVENELNDEIIYAIQNNPLTNDGELFTLSRMVPPNSAETAKYTGDPQSWLAQFGVPLEFAKKYKESDGGVRYNHNITTEWLDLVDNNTYNATDYGNAWVGKFNLPDGYQNNSWALPQDFPLLRYADVLLMLSEIENEISGPTSKSLGYLNQVRDRADINLYSLTDFSSKDQLRDSIFWERNMELCFEHHGVFDLRRRGLDKLKEIVTSKLWYDPEISTMNAQDFSIIQSGAIEEYQMLYPIPPAYLNQNPKFKQNPGY